MKPNPPTSIPAQPETVQTPFCGDLRSKKYYIHDAILTQAEDYEDASGHTWCYHTQMPLGPDGGRAAPESCTPGRNCYRSALTKPQPYVPIVLKKKTENFENPEV